MGRRKIDIRYIEDERNRQVTFTKRRNGLLKKARELSILCGAEIAVVIFSTINGQTRLNDYCSTDITKTLTRLAHFDGTVESRNNATYNSQVTPHTQSATASAHLSHAATDAATATLRRHRIHHDHANATATANAALLNMPIPNGSPSANMPFQQQHHHHQHHPHQPMLGQHDDEDDDDDDDDDDNNSNNNSAKDLSDKANNRAFHRHSNHNSPVNVSSTLSNLKPHPQQHQQHPIPNNAPPPLMTSGSGPGSGSGSSSTPGGLSWAPKPQPNLSHRGVSLMPCKKDAKLEPALSALSGRARFNGLSVHIPGSNKALPQPLEPHAQPASTPQPSPRPFSNNARPRPNTPREALPSPKAIFDKLTGDLRPPCPTSMPQQKPMLATNNNNDNNKNGAAPPPLKRPKLGSKQPFPNLRIKIPGAAVTPKPHQQTGEEHDVEPLPCGSAINVQSGGWTPSFTASYTPTAVSIPGCGLPTPNSEALPTMIQTPHGDLTDPLITPKPANSSVIPASATTAFPLASPTTARPPPVSTGGGGGNNNNNGAAGDRDEHGENGMENVDQNNASDHQLDMQSRIGDGF